MAVDKALVGAAGVHYVAFQLSSRGYAVGLTAPGVKGVDLLATNVETGKSINIQVKTMTDAYVSSRKWGPYWKWRIGKELADGPPHEAFFLAFVDLRGGSLSQLSEMSVTPDVFIVPSAGLEPLVERFPYDPQKGPPKDFWCAIEEKHAANYKNCWGLIDAALT